MNSALPECCLCEGSQAGLIPIYDLVVCKACLNILTHNHIVIEDAIKRAMYPRPTPKEPKRSRKIPGNLRTQIYERDEYCCVKCGSRKSLAIDHIKPFSLGGENTLENLQTLCRSCNSRKGDKYEL